MKKTVVVINTAAPVVMDGWATKVPVVGQQVAAQQTAGSGTAYVTVSLPDLTPGLYRLQAMVNGVESKGARLLIR